MIVSLVKLLLVGMGVKKNGNELTGIVRGDGNEFQNT